ncbi:MAG: four helix bundle protein [Phycisphaeraceae bacterium]
MGSRLRDDLLERFVSYAVRIVDLAETLDECRRPRRVIDQIIGSGTSPGAQMFEASEALSRRDFSKMLGQAAKELSETRFWLLLLQRKNWIAETILMPLLDETNQLLKIVKAMRSRTRRNESGD